MELSAKFKAVILVWFFGWALALLRYPAQSYRVVSWGRRASTAQMRRQKIVGYMCLGFGCLFLLELAFRLIR